MVPAMLKLPQGIVGLCAVVYGIYALSVFDPADYQKEDTLHAKTPTEYAEMYNRNQQKESAKTFDQIVIFGCLGLGSLQLLNAAWVAKRRQSKLDEAASTALGALKGSRLLDSMDDVDLDLD